MDTSRFVSRIGPGSADLRALIAELDADIVARYPGSRPHGVDLDGKGAVGCSFFIAWLGGFPAGCAAFRPLEPEVAGLAAGPSRCELKRVYERPEARGKGLARALVARVEAEARERGFDEMVLETGLRQPEAIALYRSMGYADIPLFGEYFENPLSVCMAKRLGIGLLPAMVEPGSYGVYRYPAGWGLPPLPAGCVFWECCADGSETSLVCPVGMAPAGFEAGEEGFSIIKLLGPLDFALVGVLSRVLAPLAREGISVFALSSYDTDRVLVREAYLARALEALSGICRFEGYRV
jgi:ribosomal protein S18 acetylase RimI-like enzyme